MKLKVTKSFCNAVNGVVLLKCSLQKSVTSPSPSTTSKHPASSHFFRYTVNEKSDKTLMKRENQYTKTYNITFWPEGFFNVPEGTELVSIEYAFTNADGSISVTQSDDDFVMLNIPLPPQKEPFIYTFYCE